MDNMNNKKNNSNLKFIICIVVLAIVIITSGFVICHLVGNRQMTNSTLGQEAQKPDRDFLVTEENVDKVKEELDKTDNSVPATYDVMMNADWNFTTGASESTNAHVTNANSNKNTVYFDVYLKDTKEVVYSSPYLRVGDEIKGFKLDKELESGEYDAICKYYILDDDLNPLCDVSVNVTLNIGVNEQ